MAGNVFAQMDGDQGNYAGPAPAPAPANSNAPSSGGNVFQQMDDAENPAAPSTSWSSLGKNFLAGMEQIPGQVVDMLANANPDAMPFQTRDLADVGKKVDTKVGKLTGLDPSKVPANTFLEKTARGLGSVLPQTLIPGEGEVTVANMLKNMATGGAVVTGATGAEELAPDSLKPAAALAGGLAAGAVLHTVPKLAGKAAGAVADAASPIVAPIRAKFSQPAAEAQAGAVLANRASDVGTVRDMLANGANEIVPGSQPTTFQQTGDVGLGALERETATKNPELFAARRGEQNAARLQSLSGIQQGGDPNTVSALLKQQFDDLDQMTQEHVDNIVQNTDKARAGFQQNQEASLGGLTDKLAAGGENLAAQHAENVSGLTAAAQARAAALGGNLTPEAYGEQVRAAVQEAEDASRTREKGLWKAVDPHGDLTGNVTQTTSAAKDIAGEIPPTAKPMTGEEAGIFEAAKSMPPLAPVQDLIALRSRVSTEMRNELISNGRSPSYARLTRLRGAIQDNLNNTISEKIANEAPAVARGDIGEGDSTLEKLQAWQKNLQEDQDAFYAKRAAAAGDVGSAGPGPSARAGAVAPASTDGTGFSATGGLNSAPGASGLPGNAPTFDAEGAGRLKEATAATKERARTFGATPVGPVLAKAGASDIYKLQEARVPERFFHPGTTGYDDMHALYRAIGQERAIPVIKDYAAFSLRRAAMREDGTLDPVKYQRWMTAHTDALRALPPDVAAGFGAAANATSDLRTAIKTGEKAAKDYSATASKTLSKANSDARAALSEHLATAQKTIRDAERARALTLKEAQKGAIGRIMGATSAEEVVGRIGSILGSKTAVGDMRELARVASKDPVAMQGLRQAVADHIAKKFISNTEAGTSGQNLIKADAFQSFVKQNRVALNSVFKPEEVKNIEAIAADINRSKRSENAIKLPGGSNTAQDTFGVRANDRQTSPAGKRVIDMLGAYIGSHFGGPIGTMAGFLGADAIQSMRAAGIDRVDQLVTKAMLEPSVAKELLAKVPAAGKVTKAGNGLARAIRASATSAALMAGASR